MKPKMYRCPNVSALPSLRVPTYWRPSTECEYVGSTDACHCDAGRTLNPVLAPAGSPTPIEWRIVRDGGEHVLTYTEDGIERWRLPLLAGASAEFVYFSRDGRESTSWPPRSGIQDVLPGSIALVQGDRAQLATVLGPVNPRIDPFQLETE